MLGPAHVLRRDEVFLSSLEQRLPAGNFYRQLDAALDLSFVRAYVADKYAASGRPSIDPVLFFKLQLILFFEGLRSERKLMETADLNVAHRWYLGVGFDEPLPDHSSLTRIRQRLGVETFQRFFEHVVERCQAAGLVWGKELFFDGTKVRANADVDSLTPRFAQAAREHVTELFGHDADADIAPRPEPPKREGSAVPEAGAGAPPTAAAASPVSAPVSQPAGDGDSGFTPRSFSGDAATDQRLAAENQARWKLLEERRLDPKRPPSGSGGYRRITDFRVSTTDPDATPLQTSTVGRLGYHDHYVVDGGRARIIVGVLVTPADVQDNQAMLDLLDRARFRFHLPVERAVADSKYATLENLRGLTQRGIQAYMPIVEYAKASPYFRQQDFTYDAATNTYRCPHGETLRYLNADFTKRIYTYTADDRACTPCPLRERCTAGRDARHVTRSFDEDLRERARERQTTEAYQKALRKRQVWVEPLFGEAKEWHQLRRFLLRGLANVNMQALLVATGQNLKRYLAAVRRGHRPAGAPRLSRFAPSL